MRVGDDLLDDRLEAALARLAGDRQRLVDALGDQRLLAEGQRELLPLDGLDDHRRPQARVADRVVAVREHGPRRGHARLRRDQREDVLAPQADDGLAVGRKRHVRDRVRILPVVERPLDVLVPLREEDDPAAGRLGAHGVEHGPVALDEPLLRQVARLQPEIVRIPGDSRDGDPGAPEAARDRQAGVEEAEDDRLPHSATASSSVRSSRSAIRSRENSRSARSRAFRPMRSTRAGSPASALSAQASASESPAGTQAPASFSSTRPPHPAVEVDDRRLARRQRVEELVRRVGLQHRVGREDRQRDVGGADDSRELLLRHRGQEAEVVEPELPRPLLEARPLAAVAEHDDRDALVAPAPQRLGRVDELVEAVRPAHRAGVERDELPLEPVTRAELLVHHARPEDVQVGRVRDQRELLARDPAPLEILLRALAEHDDPLGAGVQPPLEPLRAPHRRRALEGAELDGDGRPEVADLEHERDALQPRGGQAGDPDRERRRRGEDDVRLPLQRACDAGGDREGRERREPERRRVAVRVGDVQEEHVDAVHRLARDELPRRRLVPPGLEPARVAADDRHLVAAVDEPPGELVRPRGGRAPPGGEVLVEVEDVQGLRPLE